MVSAVLDGGHPGAFPDIETGHPLGPVDLVAREGEQVDAESVDVDRYLPKGLDGIDVKGNPVPARDLPKLAHGLERPHLGVGVHERDEDGVRSNGLLQILRPDHTVFVHGKIGDGEALRLQRLAGAEHGVVLDLRGHDVPGTPGGGDALDPEIVGLRAPGGEDDLVLGHAEESRDLLTRRLQSLPRVAAEAVHARGIAESLAEVGEHGLQHLGMHRSGGVVIEIHGTVH